MSNGQQLAFRWDLIKKVLEVGAFPLNKFVHKIPPKEMINVFIEGLLQRDVWISISDLFT